MTREQFFDDIADRLILDGSGYTRTVEHGRTIDLKAQNLAPILSAIWDAIQNTRQKPEIGTEQ